MTSTSLNLKEDKAYLSLFHFVSLVAFCNIRKRTIHTPLLDAFDKYFHVFYRNPQMRFAIISVPSFLFFCFVFSLLSFYFGCVCRCCFDAHDLLGFKSIIIWFIHSFAFIEPELENNFQSFNATKHK